MFPGKVGRFETCSKPRNLYVPASQDTTSLKLAVEQTAVIFIASFSHKKSHNKWIVKIYAHWLYEGILWSKLALCYAVVESSFLLLEQQHRLPLSLFLLFQVASRSSVTGWELDMFPKALQSCDGEGGEVEGGDRWQRGGISMVFLWLQCLLSILCLHLSDCRCTSCLVLMYFGI